MSSVLVRGGRVLDVAAGELNEHDVLAVDGRIVDVGTDVRAPDGAEVVDAAGLVVMPGLIDAHVHVTAATADLSAISTWPVSYVTAHAATILRDMLHRGFTTVRDASGADFGLARAQREGLLAGPRIAFCGKALSQTGGHGDGRGPGQTAMEDTHYCAGLGRIADGVDAVRAAARDELRKGAHHIKVMASGGVASPTDRIDSTQYSDAELAAAVEEARAANRYVAAHAYSARAVNKALRAGVRSIEHGNLIDDESVALFREHDAFLVPTLVTYWALKEEGLSHGLPASSWEKVDAVLDAGLKALERAHAGGVKIAYGSDLLGGMHRHQSREFSIRGQVQTPADVIKSATVVAADLLDMSGEVGQLLPDTRADLLLLDGDPLADLTVLAEPADHLRTVVQDGAVVVDRR
jgi:imidazolonepropionase-like amidohydrolase